MVKYVSERGEIIILEGNSDNFIPLCNAYVESIKSGIADLRLSNGVYLQVPVREIERKIYGDFPKEVFVGDIITLKKVAPEIYQIVGKNEEERRRQEQQARKLLELIRKAKSTY